MAIYHLNIRSVGKTTHKAGTAGAHARYIARPQAASLVEAAHMPADGNAARAWLNAQEKAVRKNGRVATKLVVALPRELGHEENAAAVREFVDRLTQGGRVPHLWAIHDKDGNDRENPHAHVIVHDRDPETGRAVCKFSASKRDRQKDGLAPCPVEHARKLWEEIGNRHLEAAGHAPELDRRSLKAQKIEREPTIHEGPCAQAVRQKGRRPESAPREQEAWNQVRTVDYPTIDQGQTRAEHNARVQAANDNRDAGPWNTDMALALQRAFAQRDAQEEAATMAEDHDNPNISLKEAQRRAEAIERGRLKELEERAREGERQRAAYDAERERKAVEGREGEKQAAAEKVRKAAEQEKERERQRLKALSRKMREDFDRARKR